MKTPAKSRKRPVKRPRVSALTPNLDALTGELANLRVVAGDELMAEACGLLRQRLKLTPQKLMLILLRELAPDEWVGQLEEAALRGRKPETLREAKARGDFPREINGIQGKV
jgi:hypothetical protein